MDTLDFQFLIVCASVLQVNTEPMLAACKFSHRQGLFCGTLSDVEDHGFPRKSGPIALLVFPHYSAP